MSFLDRRRGWCWERRVERKYIIPREIGAECLRPDAIFVVNKPVLKTFTSTDIGVTRILVEETRLYTNNNNNS